MKPEAKAVKRCFDYYNKEIHRLKGKVIAIESEIALLASRRNDCKMVLEKMEHEK